jgi:hypothetical protein
MNELSRKTEILYEAFKQFATGLANIINKIVDWLTEVARLLFSDKHTSCRKAYKKARFRKAFARRVKRYLKMIAEVLKNEANN